LAAEDYDVSTPIDRIAVIIPITISTVAIAISTVTVAITTTATTSTARAWCRAWWEMSISTSTLTEISRQHKRISLCDDGFKMGADGLLGVGSAITTMIVVVMVAPPASVVYPGYTSTAPVYEVQTRPEKGLLYPWM
jgi:hypothetical protein